MFKSGQYPENTCTYRMSSSCGLVWSIYDWWLVFDHYQQLFFRVCNWIVFVAYHQQTGAWIWRMWISSNPHLRNFDTFTRTPVRESKMNAVARAQLTFEMLTLLKKISQNQPHTCIPKPCLLPEVIFCVHDRCRTTLVAPPHLNKC